MAKLLCAVAGALVAASSAPATAQVYPSRPITVVVGFAAGGPTDAIIRILGERMKTSLGQPIVVENVAGGAGTVGIGRVVRTTADGYTLSVGHWSTHVVNGAIYRLPYDLLHDLEPIALLPSNPMIVVTKNAVPANDLQQLIEWMKGKPEGVTAGTAGAGSGTHVSGVYFQKAVGVPIHFIPYRGTGPALADLIAGQIDMIVDQASNALPHIRRGTIRAYAVTAKARMPSAPDIPTVDEAGLPGLHMSVWYGLWGPKGMPKDTVARISTAAMEALADPAVRQRFADLALEIPPPEQQTPRAFAAFHKAEIEKWWPIIKAANIKVD